MGRQTSRPVHLLPARRRALPGGWQNCLTYRDGAHALAQRANVFPGFAAALPDQVVICCPAAQGVLWDEDVKVPRKGGSQPSPIYRLRYAPSANRACSRHSHQTGKVIFHGFDPHTPSASMTLRSTRPSPSPACADCATLPQKMDTVERKARANRPIGLATGVAEANDALVVCGDFNVEKDSNTLDILAEARLFDLVSTQRFTSTRNAIYKSPVASRTTYW